MSSPVPECDVLARWAERLAARVAPDEIDFAADVLAAYLGGGVARRQLFAGPRADPGAFGASLPLVLPHVVDALAHCCLIVKGFLGDPAVNSAIATANLAVALQQLRKAESREGSATGSGARQPAGDGQIADSPGPDVSAVELEVVDRAADSVTVLTARLRGASVTAARAEAVAGEVLTTLATDPSSATRFLDILGKSAT